MDNINIALFLPFPKPEIDEERRIEQTAKEAAKPEEAAKAGSQGSLRKTEPFGAGRREPRGGALAHPLKRAHARRTEGLTSAAPKRSGKKTKRPCKAGPPELRTECRRRAYRHFDRPAYRSPRTTWTSLVQAMQA